MWRAYIRHSGGAPEDDPVSGWYQQPGFLTILKHLRGPPRWGLGGELPWSEPSESGRFQGAIADSHSRRKEGTPGSSEWQCFRQMGPWFLAGAVLPLRPGPVPGRGAWADGLGRGSACLAGRPPWDTARCVAHSPRDWDMVPASPLSSAHESSMESVGNTASSLPRETSRQLVLGCLGC